MPDKKNENFRKDDFFSAQKNLETAVSLLDYVIENKRAHADVLGRFYSIIQELKNFVYYYKDFMKELKDLETSRENILKALKDRHEDEE